MADTSQGMVFPLPLPVIISDKPLQTSTLDEQKTQTDLMRNQQGMWHQYLQLFGLNKNEVEQKNNQIVEELKKQNETGEKKDTREQQKDRKESGMNKLRDKLTKFWDKIKFWKYFPDLFKNIGEIAKNSYEKVKGWISDLAEWFWYALVDPSGSLITTVVSMMIPALGNLVTLAINLLTTVIPQIINMVIAALPGVMKALERIILTIVKMAPKFIDAIVKLVPILMKGLVNALPILLKAFIKLFISLFKAVVKLIPILVMGIWDAVKGMWKAFKEAWPELKQAVWEGIISIWDAMKKAWPEIKDAVWNGIKELFNFEGTDLDNQMKSITKFFSDMSELLGYIWDDIVKDFKSIYNALGGEEGLMKSFEGFKNAISDIWDSVSSFMSDMQPYIEMLVPPLIRLKDILVRVSSILLKGLKWAFDKLMVVIGPVISIILWLVKTIFKFLTPIFVWLIDIVMDVVDVFLSIIEVIGKVIDKLWEWGEILANWFSDMWKGITDTFKPMTTFLGDIWDSIVNVVKKGFDNLLGFFSNFFKKAEEEVPKTSAEETTKVVKEVIEKNVTVASETANIPINSPKVVGDVNQKDVIDQSSYNKSLKKTGESLDKGKKGFERFRGTIEKALNFRTIPLGSLASTIGGTIMNAFKSTTLNVESLIGDVKQTGAYKALVSIIDKLTDSLTKFMTWFNDLDIVKSIKDKSKAVVTKAGEIIDSLFNPSNELKFERQSRLAGGYSVKTLEEAREAAKNKLTLEQIQDISKMVAATFGNVAGKELFEEFLLRQAAGENLKSNLFFGGASGAREDVTEAFGSVADRIINAIKTSKPEEKTKAVQTILLESAKNVKGSEDLLKGVK